MVQFSLSAAGEPSRYTGCELLGEVKQSALHFKGAILWTTQLAIASLTLNDATKEDQSKALSSLINLGSLDFLSVTFR
jgi:hypothetical protein